ncbi:glycosyltransferase [Streptomyces sp. CdTB01]|uniref:glycosyltransferase n=1 Tax=Streptomyces sp. CdTB01 TaxID=1725411 RepID=UPI00073AC424|nr:glycosyltransferase [Streptomyces sp. CdTB01]ALV31010.1 N-acetylglucosaminyltransferase [Streptomyces sp. CdTB01]
MTSRDFSPRPRTGVDRARSEVLERVQLTHELRTLSGGTLSRVTPNGPRFAGRRLMRQVGRATFSPALKLPERVLVALLVAGWASCAVLFWRWWLQPEHRISLTALAVNSVLLGYLTLLPVAFVVTVLRLRRVNPDLPVPSLSVAFVVTKAPSEPWPVARKTLLAMLAQRYPHPYDVWLCDEDPTPEVEAWCRAHGVRLSTRRGIAGYHRPSWPRRTRCKEGNLAFFYDRHGYENYEVVAQLDCDHVPDPTYLQEVVRPFADPAIGYVAAPSVCDANADTSWAARGRLHREGVFHGPFQLGHNDGLAPSCIGSHYAVRTAALRQIGGLGPELAEDFSTTFLLNSAGWQGAFAIEARAHGDGPATFSAMITQEFQWSRSLVALMLNLFPRHVSRLSWKLRVRFAFAFSYYPLLGLSTAAALVLAPIAAVTGVPWVRVNYLSFLLHYWSMSVWLMALTWFLRRRGLLRPRKVPLISWENWLFALARWPFVAWGTLAAVWVTLRPRSLTFKVTPKARQPLARLPLRLVAPYVLIAAALGAAGLFGELNGPAFGYVFLCLLGAATYTVVACLICLLHAVESAGATQSGRRRALATVRAPLALTVLTASPMVLALLIFPSYLAGLLA